MLEVSFRSFLYSTTDTKEATGEEGLVPNFMRDGESFWRAMIEGRPSLQKQSGKIRNGFSRSVVEERSPY